MQLSNRTKQTRCIFVLAAIVVAFLVGPIFSCSAMAQGAAELKIFQFKRGGKDFLLPVTPSLEFGGLCSAVMAAARGITPQSEPTANAAERTQSGRRTYLQIGVAREGICAAGISSTAATGDWSVLSLFADFSKPAACVVASRADDWPDKANRWQYVLDASASSADDAVAQRAGAIRFNAVYRAFRPADTSGGNGTLANAGTGLRPVIMRIPAAGAGSAIDEQCAGEFNGWRTEIAKLRDDLFVVFEPLDPREPAYVFHDLARAAALFPRATPYFGQRPFGRQINRAFTVGMPLPSPRGSSEAGYAATRPATWPNTSPPLLVEYKEPIVVGTSFQHRKLLLPADGNLISDRRVVDAFAPQGAIAVPIEPEPEYQFRRRMSTALDARKLVNGVPANRFARLKAEQKADSKAEQKRIGFEARSSLAEYGDVVSYSFRTGESNRQQADVLDGALGEDVGDLPSGALLGTTWRRAEFGMFGFRRAALEADAEGQGGVSQLPILLQRQLGGEDIASRMSFSLDVVDGKQIYVQSFPITVRQFAWLLAAAAKRPQQMQDYLVVARTWRQQCWAKELSVDSSDPFLIRNDELQRGIALVKIFAANRAAALLDAAGLKLFLGVGDDANGKNVCEERMKDAKRANGPYVTLFESVTRNLKDFVTELGKDDGIPMTWLQRKDAELLGKMLQAETSRNSLEPAGWVIDLPSQKEHDLLANRPPMFCHKDGRRQDGLLSITSPHIDFVYSLLQPDGRDPKKSLRAELGCAAEYIKFNEAPENTAAILGLTSGVAQWLGGEGHVTRLPSENKEWLDEDAFASREIGIRLVLRPR